MNGFVSGHDIARDKIVAIYIEDEDAERDVTEEVAMVYLEGGHIITLTPDDGRLLREFWRKGNGGSVDLRHRADHAK